MTTVVSRRAGSERIAAAVGFMLFPFIALWG
jgi:hypothetical protein